MKVVILAGGFGTRLSEYTDLVPKPMVTIGNKPILWHIMSWYAAQGHTEFIIALGYKAEVVKEYFYNYRTLNTDFTVDLGSGEVSSHSSGTPDWKVTLVDTGENTMTGGRVKRLSGHIGSEPFLLTYGDGVGDIPVNEVISLHKSSNSTITVTAVRPPARFGELEIEAGKVLSFKEKPQLHEGWINGGYFVVEPRFLDLIDDDSVMLERQPLERAVANGEMAAFQHDGFWQCMDTKRDRDMLEALWQTKKAPWAI